MTARSLPSEYATISRETGMIAARHHALGVRRAAYLIARSALMLLADRKEAARLAYGIADEMAVMERSPWP